MKLIIDIPDKIYEKVMHGYVPLGLSKYLMDGTPLDDVKAEIDDEWVNTHQMYPDYASGLARASEIIYKHIGKAEKGGE